MKTILVVEDNAANRYLVRFMFEKFGHAVIEAPDGRTGVELAVSRRPDLVLMDIQLPDLDGLEATRRIRQKLGTEVMPIIALTSYAMTGDREKALEAGCRAYIEKPINPETFMQEINGYL